MSETEKNYTYAEAKTLHDTYLDYEYRSTFSERRSACVKFINGCNALLLFPTGDSVGGVAGSAVQFEHVSLQEKIKEAKSWLALNSGSGGGGLRTRKISFGGGRGPLY